METLDASDIFAALGHEARLGVFRLLVEAGPAGLNAGSIGERLGMLPATLSFHLAQLKRVGLVTRDRKSRFIHYAANFATMDAVIGFLTRNCCQGKPCLPVAKPIRGAARKAATRKPAAAKPVTRKPRR